MKVMLLSLPGINQNDGDLFPLGLGYLAAALKPGHEVQAFHYQLMTRARTEVKQQLASFKPELVGLTCSTFNRGFVRETIALIKGAQPDTKVVVGGVHASFCHEQIVREYGADFVVIGEGERTLAELCDTLERDGDPGQVPGIAYRCGGRVRLNAPRPAIRNLDDLPFPDYGYAEPYIRRSGMGSLITSRGCPVRCTFCSTSSFWGQRVRTNSVSRVVDEMELLISRFQVERIFFHDDTFNLGTARVMAICSEIEKRGLKVEWGCSCRVHPVTEEMLAAMVGAGCRHICWGIESGSREMLEKIDKKITLQQIRHAYELCAKFSDLLSTGAFTMVGNPGETEATVGETVEFLDSIPVTDAPSTSLLYILPGTMLYEELRSRGEIRESDWSAHDSVPYYTLENSYRDLARWAVMVQESGRRIPFDAKRHFWRTAPEIRKAGEHSGGGNAAVRAAKALLDPKKVREAVVRALPGGKIRF